MSQDKSKKSKNTAPPQVDPLLESLILLSEIYGRPATKASLKAGTPLPEGKLTIDLFKRLADKAHIDAEPVEKGFEDLSGDIVPCVLILKGGDACVLTDIDETGAEAIFPDSIQRSPHKISRKDLKKHYAGIVILTSPRIDESIISSEKPAQKTKNWFWGTLYQFWPIYSQVALASVFVNFFTIASSIFVLTVYDRVVPNNAITTLWALAIGISIIFIFDFILRILRGYFLDVAGKNADILLAGQIYEHVLGMRLEARPRSAGTLAHQLREFETLREFFSSATITTLVDLPFIFFFIFIIWVIGGPVAYVPLAMVPLVLIVSYFLQKPMIESIRKSYLEGGQKHALLIQSIQGLETIKGLGIEGKMQGAWERFVAQAASSTHAIRFIATLSTHLSLFAQNLTIVGVIIVGVYQIGEQNLTMGGLIACSILSGRAMGPLTQVVGLLTRLDQSLESLKRLNEIIQLPIERPATTQFVHRAKFDGEIEFKDVSFAYPNQNQFALQNVSFHIKPGERVGILGRIGSGKTTLEKLILGFYPPQSGSVLIDGTDIRQIDPANLRANVGYIPQDVFLFGGTIRHNIALGGETVHDQDLLEAAVLAGTHDFVSRHPLGYDIPVGEGGVELSGGQRQSIAIARALVRKPSIFLFDEPTAMMDIASEQNFVKRLKMVLGEDKTLILITHRPSLLSLVDRLLVIDGGHLVADGPKDKVLEALQAGTKKTMG